MYEDPHHGEGKSIENDTSRQVTFSKRRNGLLKKAFELSVSSSLLEASSLNLQALEWQHLKAESANMLKTVEDLEVSRRY
ncbi:hypothetical protein ES332_D11G247700v1 [Gossypium tomentosum]|uniref:MADS-box domain-containing protein n=1 Tax=Gossypium tomentosum TaxID=34277 RepID=A0A5D2ITL0_GOSTO|nr:hypothetical protein ES332_D11G247700v1 [Gossypium tomentosum]